MITNQKLVAELMTKNPVCAYPDMIMTEVADIFEEYDFHHLPVVDSEDMCIGVISKSDYLHLQDKFTRFGAGRCAKGNKRFFASLLAKEVMTPFPRSVKESDTVDAVLKVFLENKIHSLIVTSGDKFSGIITPFDLLQWLAIELKESKE